jgi:hypothetical protein
MVKPIPDGYNSATPYLIFEDANSAIDLWEALRFAELNPLRAGLVPEAESCLGRARQHTVGQGLPMTT